LALRLFHVKRIRRVGGTLREAFFVVRAARPLVAAKTVARAYYKDTEKRRNRLKLEVTEISDKARGILYSLHINGSLVFRANWSDSGLQGGSGLQVRPCDSLNTYVTSREDGLDWK
jgi:hypothetical protein